MRNPMNFKEFWPWYVEQHQHPVNIALHFIATIASIAYAAAALAGLLKFNIFLLLLISYGPSWIGHFVFEKNKPATFRHPFWSLLADFRLCGRLIRFKKVSP